MYTIKIFKGKELDLYKNTLFLNDIQREVIIGTLLGDATMGLREGKSLYSIKFEQSIKNEMYINHLYEIFEPFVGMVPTKLHIKNDKYSIWFRTYRHASFKYYFDIFYSVNNNYVKVMPTIIKKLLTPRVLAYWYMDDGSIKGSAYTLHTQCYNLSDQKLILDGLKKFNIKASIHKDKDKYRVYILSESRETFKSLIKPYIIECFNYKL